MGKCSIFKISVQNGAAEIFVLDENAAEKRVENRMFPAKNRMKAPLGSGLKGKSGASGGAVSRERQPYRSRAIAPPLADGSPF